MPPSDTPEPLSDEEIETVRDFNSRFVLPVDSHFAVQMARNTIRLLDEHARLKATVERVRSAHVAIEAWAKGRKNGPVCAAFELSADAVKAALSPDASTTETKRCPKHNPNQSEQGCSLGWDGVVGPVGGPECTCGTETKR